MLREVSWPGNRNYSSGTQYPPIDFYLNSFSKSLQCDLLLGYFSTAAINLLSLSFARFISRGGRIRLIINNHLSAKDKETIQNANDSSVLEPEVNYLDYYSINKVLSKYDEHFFNCLSWLIRNRTIDVKIVKPKNEKGISHFKSGFFSDVDSNVVEFHGSANFTANALIHNLESITIRLSWDSENDNKIIAERQKEYNSIFEGTVDYVEHVSVDSVMAVLKEKHNTIDKDLSELLVEESELVEYHSKLGDGSHTTDLILKSLKEELALEKRKPRFPYDSGPRDYQIEAYENWKNNGKKGIFCMATGTGKTITALNCVVQETTDCNQCYQAIILVPSRALLRQWEIEVRRFNFNDVYVVGGNTNWRNDLTRLVGELRFISVNYIIIVTYQSLVTEDFTRILKGLSDSTILIADEAHNIGRAKVIESISFLERFSKRLGLSATPIRDYDENGNIKIEGFFNDKPPYTVNFPIEKAISEGILCNYNYYPVSVELTDKEFEKYVELTRRISQLHGLDDEQNEGAKRLRILRKRLTNAAVNKVQAIKEILNDIYVKKNGLKYTFIYVPEGSIRIGMQKERLLDAYMKVVSEIGQNVYVNKIVAGQADAERITVMNQFSDGRIGVLTSIKCLDEGVDIPRAEYAIFCSSNSTERQFIQRRGRVLRTHPEKHLANLYDLVVVPNYKGRTSETYIIEKNLLKNELRRVIHFSKHSLNPFYAQNMFKNISKKYNVSINNL